MNGTASAIVRRLADEAGLQTPSIIVRPADPGCFAAEVDPDASLYPASMIKVPIAFALEDAVASGGRRLTDRVRIDERNLTPNDAPSPMVAGYEPTLLELGTAMLAASDNVATNVLIDVLGRGTIDAACFRLGLERTHVRRKLSGALPLIDDPEATGRNAHPASDAARLFSRLLSGGPAWIYAALRDQIWNDKLAAGFSAGDRFAHKTGDTSDVSHDGGILTTAGGRTFVVVVYTSLAATPENDARVATFARTLRPHLV